MYQGSVYPAENSPFFAPRSPTRNPSGARRFALFALFARTVAGNDTSPHTTERHHDAGGGVGVQLIGDSLRMLPFWLQPIGVIACRNV